MKRKEAIDQLREIQEISDLKVAHRLAGDVLCRLLHSLGYGDLVAEYNKVRKWYDRPTSCSLSRLFGWCARGLYPLARGCRRIWRGAFWAARCLLDRLGPAQRLLAADGEVAGGADSFLVIFRFGATLELGRSARGTGSTLPTPLIESRVD